MTSEFAFDWSYTVEIVRGAIETVWIYVRLLSPILGALLLLDVIWFFRSERPPRAKMWRMLVHALSALWVVALLAVVVRPRFFDGIRAREVLPALVFFGNAVPFGETSKLITLHITGDELARHLRDIVGNVLLFIPLGVLIPLVFQRLDRWLSAVGAALLVAYLGEMTQGLITHGGSSIDDALFNGLGGVIGYALFRAVRAMWRRTRFARHDEGAQGAPVPAPPA